jgi:uncharacterized membrane protein SpoIIM required for sporulation
MTDIQTPAATVNRSLLRRIGQGMLICLAILVALTALVLLLNAVFLGLFNNIQQWQEWRADHYWHLLAWRLTLYTVLAVTWFKLKANLSKSELQQSYKRLLKVEIMVVLLALLIEVSKVLLQPGGVL